MSFVSSLFLFFLYKGRPLAWGTHDDENTAFRQCMARIRLQERRFVQQRRAELGHDVVINIGYISCFF